MIRRITYKVVYVDHFDGNRERVALHDDPRTHDIFTAGLKLSGYKFEAEVIHCMIASDPNRHEKP